MTASVFRVIKPEFKLGGKKSIVIFRYSETPSNMNMNYLSFEEIVFDFFAF